MQNLNLSNYQALLFPGQGSQYLGMLSEINESLKINNINIIEIANKVLGYDIASIIQNDQNKLNQSEYTQPAILLTSVARYLINKNKLNNKVILAGHSLGEYSALVCSNVLSLNDAISLVSLRGKLMQKAGSLVDGAMAAIIGLKLEEVMACCALINNNYPELGLVSVANINTPIQIVVAGQKSAIEQLLVIAKEKGAKRGLILPVSVPAHSEFMRPIVHEFDEYLAKCVLSAPTIPVLMNYNLSILDANNFDAKIVRQALSNQLVNPVNWVGLITKFYQEFNIVNFCEVGPGLVLTGLVKKIMSSFSNSGTSIDAPQYISI